jgi:hypothetical protein
MHLIRDRICVSFASTNYYDDNQTKETLSLWNYFMKRYKCILLETESAYHSRTRITTNTTKPQKLGHFGTTLGKVINASY